MILIKSESSDLRYANARACVRASISRLTARQVFIPSSAGTLCSDLARNIVPWRTRRAQSQPWHSSACRDIQGSCTIVPPLIFIVFKLWQKCHSAIGLNNTNDCMRYYDEAIYLIMWLWSPAHDCHDATRVSDWFSSASSLWYTYCTSTASKIKTKLAMNVVLVGFNQTRWTVQKISHIEPCIF